MVSFHEDKFLHLSTDFSITVQSELTYLTIQLNILAVYRMVALLKIQPLAESCVFWSHKQYLFLD